MTIRGRISRRHSAHSAPNAGGTGTVGRSARCRRKNWNSSGYILVQTLVVISALTALMAILAADQHQAIQQTQNRLDERRADQAVNAAVARAMATLASANTSTVTLNDAWATLGQDGIAPNNQTGTMEPYEYSLDPSGQDDPSAPTFRMQVVDAGSLVNLNTAAYAASLSANNQNTLVQSFTQQLLNLDLTQQQADSLLDWEQTGETARSDGAKDSFYNGLPQPYNAKLAALDTVDETLLVDNWTAQSLYVPPQSQQNSTVALPTDAQGNVLPLAAMVTVDSGSPNTQASGTARVNVTSGNGNLGSIGLTGLSPQATATLRQAQTFQQALAAIGGNTTREQALLNGATFSNNRWQGKINLNTAPQYVLMTIPGMTTSIASAIVAQQQSGFTSLGQLATIDGITPPLLQQMADYFTIGSDTWIVRVYGHSGNVGVADEIVVRVTNSQPQVITWDRLSTPTVPEWWDWQTSPGTIDAVQNT